MNPKIKKIIAREGIVMLACLAVTSILNAYFLRIVPPHPSYMIGLSKLFLSVYIPVLILMAIVRFIIRQIASNKSNRESDRF